MLLRLKEDYDGAEPSASSVAALNVLTLAHLTGDGAYRDKAERTLQRYGLRVGAAGRVIPMMLCALSQWHAPIDADRGRRRPDRRRRQANSNARSRHTTCRSPCICRSIRITNQDALRTRLPFVDGMQAHGGGAVYVCRDFTCRQPVSSIRTRSEASCSEHAGQRRL